MKNVEFDRTRTVWVDSVRMFAMVCIMYMVHAFTISIFKALHIHLSLNDWQYMCYAIPTTIIWVTNSFMILYTLRYKVIRKLYWGMA